MDVDSLGTLIYQKTQGNPFFVNQFLMTLYKDKHIYFNSSKNRWDCDTEAVREANYTSNVVDMMVTSLSSRLEEKAHKMIGVAALVSYVFDLNVVADVCNVSVNEASSILQTAIQYVFLSSSVDFLLTLFFYYLLVLKRKHEN